MNRVFGREAGQARRRWLDEKTQNALDAAQYYLGPGVPVNQLAEVVGMLNPVNDLYHMQGATRRAIEAEPGERFPHVMDAATNALTFMAPVAGGAIANRMYSAAGGSLADDGARAANALAETFTSSSQAGKRAARDFAADQGGAVGRAADETPAQEVARMLREGRSDEVTNDMMARVDPQEMYLLYEGGATGRAMPMDEASRMARAREMGFDAEAPLYHGTRSDISAMRPSKKGKIGPGVYVTENPRLASAFADGADGANIMSLNAKRNPAPEMFRTEASAIRRAESDPSVGARKFTDYLDDMGFSGVRVEDQETILNPRNIRSRFARFDPRLSHLANLSAAGAGAAVLSNGQEEDAGWSSARQRLQQMGLFE